MIILYPYLFMIVDLLLSIFFDIKTLWFNLFYLVTLLYGWFIWFKRTNVKYLSKRKNYYYLVKGYKWHYYMKIPKTFLKKEDGKYYMNPKEYLEHLCNLPEFKKMVDFDNMEIFESSFLPEEGRFIIHNKKNPLNFTFDPIYTANKRNSLIDNLLND